LLIGNSFMKCLTTVTLILLSFLSAQESIIYWNSLSTSVKVDVPIAEDETLEGGRVQIRVSFDGGDNFKDLGQPFPIEGGDLSDLKEILIPRQDFVSLDGYSEGGTAQFIAEIWDRAGNSVVGTVSDSVLTIDETIPVLNEVTVTSTNVQNNSLAKPDDMLTLTITASEGINMPVVEINGDEFPATGEGNSWKVENVFEDEDDGLVTFSIDFKDYAQNPGTVVTATTDESKVAYDGTAPELDNIRLYSKNSYDQTLAVKGDSIFLDFMASETLFTINVTLNGNEISQLTKTELQYRYLHVLTEKDAEGSIPFTIDYNDLAGNSGEQILETSDGSEVLFDMTPPATFKVESVGSSTKKSKSAAPVEAGKPSSSKGQTALPAFFTGTTLIIAVAVTGVLFLLMVLSWWKIFSKANQAGWKVLVPFLNLIVLTKILNKPIWWMVIYLILPVGHILVSLQLAKFFGKKIIFAVGMILLPFVFYPLLAFSKAQIAEPAAVPE